MNPWACRPGSVMKTGPWATACLDPLVTCKQTPSGASKPAGEGMGRKKLLCALLGPPKLGCGLASSSRPARDFGQGAVLMRYVNVMIIHIITAL